MTVPSGLDLVQLAESRQLAFDLLSAFARAGAPERLAMQDLFKPREEDYKLVFQAPFDEVAKRGYAPLWDAVFLPEIKPGQSEVHVLVAPAMLLRNENPVSREFPGGFQKVAEQLNPELHWVAWKFVEPGRALGMSHNGLVRVDQNRWAWFPKPWRLLQLPLVN